MNLFSQAGRWWRTEYAVPLLGFALFSCAKAEPPKPVTFADDEIGWTVTYPDTMKRLDAAEIAKLENSGEEILEDAAGGEIEKNHRNLLYLKSDETNSFTSAVQPFDAEVDGDYDETREALFDVIVEAYEGIGLPVEHERGEETIDGLTFHTLTVRLYKPGKEEVVMNQVAYDRLLGGKHSFMISINWNNAELKTVFEEVVRSSKFSIRD